MSNVQLQEQIDRELWWPIRRAYNARDIDSLLLLYSPDVIRAGGPNREILDFAGLAAAGSAWFGQLRDDGTALEIDFRFTERILDKDSASERGIFKITTTKLNEPGETIYGRFHVFLRRLDRWMIVVDYDSHDREPVGSQDFGAAQPVSALA
jgi:ketosteroid isomerase-like protein